MGNILVCDDERSICEMLDISLRRDGHRVETVQAGQAAKNKIDGALYDVIITDIKMPNIDGIEVLRHAHQVSPDSAVILITAVDDYEAAVEAVKAGGASDYIRKGPGLVDEIRLAIKRALEKLVLSRQNFALRRDAATHNSLDNIIGSSPPWTTLKADAPHGRFHREHGAGPRRERDRKRTGRARGACVLAACYGSVRLRQLRSVPRDSARKRAVRLSQGRIYRSEPEQARPLRSGRMEARSSSTRSAR